MRQEKISIASMSAILGGHYLGKRGRLDALLLGWEYFWLLMITRKLPRQGDNSKVECLFACLALMLAYVIVFSIPAG